MPHPSSGPEQYSQEELRASAERKAARAGYEPVTPGVRVRAERSDGSGMQTWEVAGKRIRDGKTEYFLWSLHPERADAIRVKEGVSGDFLREQGNDLGALEGEPIARRLESLTAEIREAFAGVTLTRDNVARYPSELEEMSEFDLDDQLNRLRDGVAMAREFLAAVKASLGAGGEFPTYERYRASAGAGALTRAQVETMRITLRLARELLGFLADRAREGGDTDAGRSLGMEQSDALVPLKELERFLGTKRGE